MDVSNVHIRWMIRRDLTEILQIEETSFVQPWSKADLEAHLKRRDTVIAMVAECGERIVGYYLHELARNKIELLRIAIRKDMRRLGIGSTIMDKLKTKLRVGERDKLTLTVSERNLPAHLFFKATGWRATKVMPHEFGDEAGYRMVYRIPQPVPMLDASQVS